ncbi:MAG: hypothetical protein IJ097_03945 [Bacilli bacterium]|nr:hypothetical protein [Bacilli bacterium]
MEENKELDVLTLVNSYNDKLIQRRERNNNSSSILKKIINGNDLTEEEKENILKSFPSFDEGMFKRIYAINQIMERGFELYSEQQEQLNIYNQIISTIAESLEQISASMKNIQEILSKIKLNEHLNPDILNSLVDGILDKSCELSLDDKIKLMEELIKYNANCKIIGSDNKTNNNDINEGTRKHVVNLNLTEHEIKDLDEKIKFILSKYDYVYEDLDEYSKNYLRKAGYENLDTIDKVLETLINNGIRIDTAKMISSGDELIDEYKNPINLVFCKIIVSPNTIELFNDLKEDFKSIKLEEFIKFIRENPRILIPNSKKSSKSSLGESLNEEYVGGLNTSYREIKTFLDSKNISFNYVFKKVKTMLLKPNSDNVKRNYNIYNDVYNIPFITDNTPRDEEGKYKPGMLSALNADTNTIVENIDKLIESSVTGYEYVRNNPTISLSITTPKELDNLYKIKISEKVKYPKENNKYDNHIFFTNGKKGIQLRKSSSAVEDEELKVILDYTLEEAQKVFDPTSIDNISGNWKKRQLFDVSRDEEENNSNIKIKRVIGRFKELAKDEASITKKWEVNPEVINNPYIRYLEDNCRVDSNDMAYDYIYKINDDSSDTYTIISRKKVLRIFGQLINQGISDDVMIKLALSYESIINEADAINILVLVDEMQNKINEKSLTGGVK